MTDSPPSRAVTGTVCSAEVLDEGALVLRWQPAGHEPVLFVHPTVGPRSGRPPHAGVPVCWPWFGPGRAGGAPYGHGFARGAVWSLVEETQRGDATVLRHRLTEADATDPFWPHPYVLELTAHLGADLGLELATTNTGDAPVVVEEALHAYLAVGDVRRVVVSGLDGAPFHDKVTGTDHVQEGDLVLTGETDRVHRGTRPVTVTDPVLGRRLHVETDGAANRVVWNPWAEKAAAIDDVGDHWHRFVCVEGANVLADAVTLPPGATHTLTYRLTVEDL
ncbi:D-hexose-6-phosphate mutarotase [Phycicoccus sp. CSK15P-2]|uniref:D-hexose-6-phosphate mutarotase n=1 Tax=Phycicoccus sp. CSK15P-2 TaxID=2807627 RepID=UPI00194F1C3D|nr:D-hexose-6-phosphate mutarotase [Phycicoccus sp. CSK15P-2]MBM6403077.1 D-hexose-6-phosphate mutarotase [Phycicoccus sp. CSK15P-2]